MHKLENNQKRDNSNNNSNSNNNNSNNSIYILKENKVNKIEIVIIKLI